MENARVSEPSILSRLRSDHRRVLRDVAALESASPALRGDAPAARPRVGGVRGRPVAWTALRSLVTRLERQFATHMVAEDESLFPALEKALPEARGSLQPLRAEHAELRALLESLAALLRAADSGARDEQVVVQWRDFAALLRIHIRKEESVVFNVAEHALPPRELARVEALRFPLRAAARGRPHTPKRKDVRP
jgi:hypothetical protein